MHAKHRRRLRRAPLGLFADGLDDLLDPPLNLFPLGCELGKLQSLQGGRAGRGGPEGESGGGRVAPGRRRQCGACSSSHRQRRQRQLPRPPSPEGRQQQLGQQQQEVVCHAWLWRSLEPEQRAPTFLASFSSARGFAIAATATAPPSAAAAAAAAFLGVFSFLSFFSFLAVSFPIVGGSEGYNMASKLTRGLGKSASRLCSTLHVTHKQYSRDQGSLEPKLAPEHIP